MKQGACAYFHGEPVGVNTYMNKTLALPAEEPLGKVLGLAGARSYAEIGSLFRQSCSSSAAATSPDGLEFSRNEHLLEHHPQNIAHSPLAGGRLGV